MEYAIGQVVYDLKPVSGECRIYSATVVVGGEHPDHLYVLHSYWKHNVYLSIDKAYPTREAAYEAWLIQDEAARVERRRAVTAYIARKFPNGLPNRST